MQEYVEIFKDWYWIYKGFLAGRFQILEDHGCSHISYWDICLQMPSLDFKQ